MHTPGPWWLVDYTRDLPLRVTRHLRIYSAERPASNPIACVNAESREDQDNARLISAATELLAACKAAASELFCRSHSHSNVAGCFHCAVVQQVHAAIAKATEGTA